MLYLSHDRKWVNPIGFVFVAWFKERAANFDSLAIHLAA